MRHNNPTSLFLYNVSSNSFFPSQSKTLIDNILCKGINGSSIWKRNNFNVITSYQVHSRAKPKKIPAQTFKSFV